jgi:hypothetical protein
MPAGNACPQVTLETCRKIYELFVVSGVAELSRYKNLFLYSLEKIKDEMASHLQKLANCQGKRGMPNPVSIIQVFIQEEENLLVCLQNSYKEDEQPETSYLHSLLTS